jgi:Putative DNA-binding domain
MKKDIQDWTEADLLNLIRINLPESATLEFKGCDSLRKIEKKDWRKEFAKDVSAFANSGGGIVIYGIIENRRTHEAESLDGGFDPAELNIETLEQLANSNIQRRIEGIKYKSISLTGDRTGRYVYLLDIPESSRAPHMAGHRFYKRYNFESVYMEEYEVRERYRRETFPGKEIVLAWRDDAINPLIATLESENKLLARKQWTWNRSYHSFSGLSQFANKSFSSANEEDFLSRHKEITDLLQEHDSTLKFLNDTGQELFEQLSKSPALEATFATSTSDDSLIRLKSENPNVSDAETAEAIFTELFGTDWDKQDRLDTFAEWGINNKPETNINRMIAFWRRNAYNFGILPGYSEFYPNGVRAREKLFNTNEALLSSLKRIRKELSEHHNVPVAASHTPYEVGFLDPFSSKRSQYY